MVMNNTSIAKNQLNSEAYMTNKYFCKRFLKSQIKEFKKMKIILMGGYIYITPYFEGDECINFL